MTERSVGTDGMEIETPAYGGRFILLMIGVAVLTLAVQFVLTILITGSVWSTGSKSLPIAGNKYVVQPGLDVLPGNSVVWKGELWVCPDSTANPRRGKNVPRSVRSRLVKIDLATREPQDSGFGLSPAPVGLQVVDDQLFAVSEINVSYLENNQLVTRHPRRALQQPTKPFVYQGQLSVIDKNKNDIYTLLTWNDGEWLEAGQVEAPTSANTSNWFTPELRVIADDHSIHLFYCDAQTISYREGIVLVSAGEPASALTPANVQPVLYQVAAKMPDGWRRMPVAVNWGLNWDAGFVNGELCFFSSSSTGRNQVLLRHKLQGGIWLPSQPSRQVVATNLSVASGSPGYVVTNGMQLMAADDFHPFNPVTPAVTIADGVGIGIGMFFSMVVWMLPIMIANGLSGLCVWRLMNSHRSSHYFYGKRTAVQASVVRRGFARAIDTFLMIFPAFVILCATSELQWTGAQSNRSNGLQEPIVLLLFFLFGLWCATSLVISFMEGMLGITPGKWLCGIRTLRTTLRPCGVLRALARELMIYVDSMLLFIWLPGILTIAFTKNRQRLGDLVSDTVVVLESQRDATAAE